MQISKWSIIITRIFLCSIAWAILPSLFTDIENFNTASANALNKNNKHVEIIVIDEDKLLKAHDAFFFSNELHVKTLLEKEGVHPNTTDWMEITLLCEKIYTHLENIQNMCIYKYSKIISQYNKTLKYCNHTTTANSEHSICMKKYGFSEANNWKSYKNPIKKNQNKDNKNDTRNTNTTEQLQNP